MKGAGCDPSRLCTDHNMAILIPVGCRAVQKTARQVRALQIVTADLHFRTAPATASFSVLCERYNVLKDHSWPTFDFLLLALPLLRLPHLPRFLGGGNHGPRLLVIR